MSIKRILSNLLSGILILGAVGASAASLYLGGKNNGWFDKQPETEQSQPNKTENNGGTIDSGDIAGKGVSLMSARIAPTAYAANGISAQAESAYTLTAVLEPADSMLTDFTWSGKFENPNSEWANGKAVSDYVTVTPAKDNLSAKVECLQAFGEPVIVSVTYNFNTEITAARKFDYVKRIESATTRGSFHWEDSGDNCVFPVLTYGVGTVQGDLFSLTGSYELSDDAFDYITSATSPAYVYYSRFLEEYGGVCELKKLSLTWGTCNLEEYDDYLGDSQAFLFTSVGVNLHSHSSYKYLQAAFKTLAQNTTNQYRAVLNYTYKYGKMVNGKFETYYSYDGIAYSEYESINPNNIETSVLSLSGINVPESDWAF